MAGCFYSERESLLYGRWAIFTRATALFLPCILRRHCCDDAREPQLRSITLRRQLLDYQFEVVPEIAKEQTQPAFGFIAV